MVGSATPPADTTSAPPLDTLVSVAVPPADTISVPPLRIEVSTLVPPNDTFSTPLRMVVPLSSPPEPTMTVPPTDRGVGIGAAGEDLESDAGADDKAGEDFAGAQRQGGPVRECNARRQRDAAEEFKGTAARNGDAADRGAQLDDLRAPGFDEVVLAVPPDSTSNMPLPLTVVLVSAAPLATSISRR